MAEVDTGLVMQVLEPLWPAKPETASRLRGRIEAILDWAKVRGHREGENPARWRGHLDKLLPARAKIQRLRHHSALPWQQMPAFIVELRARNDTAARALEFAILTASRTGEVIGARWPEVDLSEKVWSVPAERMKGGRAHRVPLSDRAVEILADLPRELEEGFVFVGPRAGAPLSGMALAMVLRRMGRTDVTVHGFRSTFRDWAGESTAYPREVAEMALAHAVPDKVEAAYRRGDLIAKRRRLMTEWAWFCASALLKTTITPIRGKEHA